MNAGQSRAVVAGATGQVGEGVVAALVARGWQVTALGRSAKGLSGLVSRLGDPDALRTMELDPSDGGWQRFAESIDTPQLVVASLGGWFSGPELAVLPRPDFDRVLGDGLTAHLGAAQAFLPAMEQAGGGTYVMINGAAALAPVPGSGVVSVVTAAQLMLARVLAAEAQAVTVRSLVIATPVLSRSRPDGPPGWVSARDVGSTALALHTDPGSEVVVTLDRPVRGGDARA